MRRDANQENGVAPTTQALSAYGALFPSRWDEAPCLVRRAPRRLRMNLRCFSNAFALFDQIGRNRLRCGLRCRRARSGDSSGAAGEHELRPAATALVLLPPSRLSVYLDAMLAFHSHVHRARCSSRRYLLITRGRGAGGRRRRGLTVWRLYRGLYSFYGVTCIYARLVRIPTPRVTVPYTSRASRTQSRTAAHTALDSDAARIFWAPRRAT